MSQRTLLIGALALMAVGLLLGGTGVVFGGAAGPGQAEFQGPNGQQGPEGGFRPGRPGFPPGFQPGERNEQPVPQPAPAAKPIPSASPTA